MLLPFLYSRLLLVSVTMRCRRREGWETREPFTIYDIIQYESKNEATWSDEDFSQYVLWYNKCLSPPKVLVRPDSEQTCMFRYASSSSDRSGAAPSLHGGSWSRLCTRSAQARPSKQQEETDIGRCTTEVRQVDPSHYIHVIVYPPFSYRMCTFWNVKLFAPISNSMWTEHDRFSS